MPAKTDTTISISLLEHFSVLADPRRHGGNKRHKLDKILGISVCAILSGAESWQAVELFAVEKEEWLGEFLDLSDGVPSHDTFSRVFSVLDPEEFQRCFIAWVESIRKYFANDIISIDGKSLRRSVAKANNKLPFHLVSAWSSENELSLGQVQVTKKSNEIVAIPKLLKLLTIEGCIVTLDAMGCQKAITKEIRAKKADYVIALKANQGNLYSRAKGKFTDPKFLASNKIESFETSEKSHGRIEKRLYRFTTDINFLEPVKGFSDLNAVGSVEATRTLNGKTSKETRFFIASLGENQVSEFARAVRCHWGIENKLHWILDVTMREDYCRVRKDYGAQNFAMLRKAIYNLIKQDKNPKLSFTSKKLKATWNPQYTLEVLTGKFGSVSNNL